MSALLLQFLDSPAAFPGPSHNTSFTGWVTAARLAGPWRAALALRHLLDRLALTGRSGTGRRLGWRLEQRGVPVNVRQRRPIGSRRPGQRPGRRLDWPELFDSLDVGVVGATVGTAAPVSGTGLWSTTDRGGTPVGYRLRSHRGPGSGAGGGGGGRRGRLSAARDRAGSSCDGTGSGRGE